jgi:hypothetical protein
LPVLFLNQYDRDVAQHELKRRVFEQRGHAIQEAGIGLFGDLKGAGTAPPKFAEQVIPASATTVTSDQSGGRR